jgi:uncharacterized protein YebE (UPF0316 family)
MESWMSVEELTRGLVMAGMAMASVALWTLRVALAARRAKLAGAVVAAVEAVVFVAAFSSLAGNLGSPLRVGGYAVGVALGTLAGLVTDERASHGRSQIQVVIHGHDDVLADSLHALGWPATTYAAEGPSGPVTVTFLAVDDSRVPQVTVALERLVPDAFWTVQQLRRTHVSPPHHPPLEVRHGSSTFRHPYVQHAA